MRKTIRNFLRDPRGSTAMEYALIGSLISIAAIGALMTIGPTVASMFESVATELSAASSGGS